ncbi:MAG: M20/M25/M40 family metallo-hydrolase [Rectinemataceae bacterium]
MPLVLVVSTIVLAFVATVLARTFAVPAAAAPKAPLAPEELESRAGIEDKLAAAVRFATISSWDAEHENPEAFAAFVSALPGLFPRVHAALAREVIGDRALLYTWQGSDPSLEPAILCAHFDVVPAEDAAEWRHGPFSGDLADGFVWGRGTQDIKVMLVSALEAAERLLSRGFQPRRSILFAFGGDEEVGGNRGAALIAKELARRGTRAAFLLDEGGPVAKGMLAMADRPLALVGIAEKGYIDVRLEAKGAGGHASMPPRRTATGDIARAVAALEAQPSSTRIGFTVRSFLGRLRPYVPFGYRILFSNLWVFGPLVKLAFSGSPTTAALLRSTWAATMLEGSPKENVLAAHASAIINVRILPGEDSAGVLDRIARIVSRFAVIAAPAHADSVVEPLPESSLDTELWRAIEAALGDAFPEAAMLPFLFSAGTDTKHYRHIARAMYRLTALVQTSEDLAGVHGKDERVEVSNLRRCLRFYETLIGSL